MPSMPSFFNAGTLNSPGVSALSNNNNNNNNNNGHGHFTSANSSLFPGHEDHNVSSGSQQDHTLQTPFSNNHVNGMNSKVEYQGQELLKILLQEAAPTKREIQENIKNEVKPEVKREIKEETLDEIKDLKAEVNRLKSVVAEMEKLWTQLLSYQ
jgi:hypothetical protein